jgi:hypothetical protein
VVAGNAVVFAYLLVTGREGLLQAGPPLFVNLVLRCFCFSSGGKRLFVRLSILDNVIARGYR